MAAMRRKGRTHAVAYAGLAVLFLVSLTNWARDARDRIDEIRHGATYVGGPFDLAPLTLRATNVGPDAAAAGLRNRDVVLAVDGRPLEGLSDYHGALRRARVGDHLRLHVRSTTDGARVEKTLSIPLPRFTYLGFTQENASAYAYIVLIRIAIPLFCLALGFWVAFARIGDPAAWLLLVLMLSFANTILDSRTIFGNEDRLQPVLTAFSLTFSSCAPVALAFFGIAFPEPLALDRRRPWIKWVVFGPLVGLVVFRAVLFAVEMHHAAAVMPLWAVYQPLERLEILSPAALVTFFAALGYKTVTASSRDARRRLLLLGAAAVASVVPIVILYVLSVARSVRIQGWTGVVPMVMLLIFPLTMAYVIVVHRAMDVRVVVRQGVQYVLARGGIRVIQLALIAAVSTAAAAVLSVGTGLARLALVVASIAAIVAIGGRFAERLRSWVDRRFFREAYEADAILGELATQVRTMVETGPLLETVATRIAASLHVPRIAILLDGAGAFRPAYALGYPAPPNAAIPAESATVNRLRQQPHALVRFEDADSWVQSTNGVERESLQRLGSELLLPLSLNETLLGIMSLGAKQSEEPFSRTDIRLLSSVAAQTGLALENGRLTAAIAAEVTARAKEKRDLELAREVQERLFPQAYPAIPGLDYAGACRPALGVGGDYYDFILLPNANLGIAIGDVSGKGIPAALLMATLRAYLRGAQTMHHQADLRVVMRNLNTLVYESSAPNRYATFFYGELDSSTRVLTYVNAGHNQPLLFRKAADGGEGGDLLRLEAGGTVIGLMEDCEYEQGRVTLAPGDVLVAFTDGVSEAMNDRRDEWGEPAIIEVVRTSGPTTASALTGRLIDGALAFTGAAPQHDDITAMVVRIV